MIERVLIGWHTQQKNKLDAPLWLEMLHSKGVETQRDDAPVYSDFVPRRSKNGLTTIDVFPDLKMALTHLMHVRGRGALVVPNFGHFAYEGVWKAVWAKVEEYGAAVISCEGNVAISDYETGLVLLRSHRGRTNAEKRKAARMKTGRPRKGAAPGKKAAAIKMFGDRTVTMAEIGDHLGCDRQTVRRRMEEWTGVKDKSVAVLLADQDGWPPERKLTIGQAEALRVKLGLA